MENRQKSRKGSRCSTLLKMLEDFCGYTSFGGLGRVVGTKFIVFKAIWVLLFLAAMVIVIWQLIPLFFKYQNRPISTQISLHHKSTLAFPSVVFCNFNMIRKSEIPSLPAEVRDVLNNYISATPITEQEDPGIQPASPLPEEEYEENFEDESEYNPYLLDSMYKKEEKLSVLMAGISEQVDLELLGHQFGSMIRSCTFKGVNCRNFTKYWGKFWHYKYGNCFVFNPYVKGGKEQKGARTSKPGPLYGLAIEMNIQQEEYIDQLTQNAGAVVLVSVRGKMPFPYEEGLSLAPGFSTSMGVRLLQINREDRFKNQSCIKTDSVNTENIYKKPFNVTYSKTACEQSCLAYYQRKECDCREYKFPVTDKVKICDSLNITTAMCLRNVSRKAQNNQLSCSKTCRPLCSDKLFQISSSFSSWPSSKYQKFLVKELEEDKVNQSTVGGLSKNLLKIHIFFQELNYEIIQESISYQIENFLSDVGGQLGLWLGVSVLSGVEVLELLAFMFIYLFRSRHHDAQTDSTIDMEEGGGRDNKTTEF